MHHLWHFNRSLILIKALDPATRSRPRSAVATAAGDLDDPPLSSGMTFGAKRLQAHQEDLARVSDRMAPGHYRMRFVSGSDWQAGECVCERFDTPTGAFLLHGLSSTPAELRYLSRALAKEGLTTHVPTLAGYSAGTGHAPMEQWIDAALAEFDALAAQHEHVLVCGLSMGATLAAAVAQQRPNVRALLVLSITFNYDGWAMPWYRFLVNAL